MILAVVGSRDFKDESFIFNKLDQIKISHSITGIISGGAHGVNLIAKKWALKNGLKYIEKTPDWNTPSPGVTMRKNKFGKPYNPIAGLERNTLIVDECHCLIAFWDGQSSGTKDSIEKARKQFKILEIVYVSSKQR